MEFLVILWTIVGIGVGFGVKWLANRDHDKVDDRDLPPAGHYKRIQREKDVKEWNNEYISALQDAFLSQYKIPYNEAQLAYVAHKNYISAKSVIDRIGDRAYWFDECPKVKSPYTNDYEDHKRLAMSKSKKEVKKIIKSGTPYLDPMSPFFGLGPEYLVDPITTVTDSSVTTFTPSKRFSSGGLIGPTKSNLDIYPDDTLGRPYSTFQSGMITANYITAETIKIGQTCSCDSCDFSAKMDRLTHCKGVWETTLARITKEYPEFVFENLPKELPELSA